MGILQRDARLVGQTHGELEIAGIEVLSALPIDVERPEDLRSAVDRDTHQCIRPATAEAVLGNRAWIGRDVRGDDGLARYGDATGNGLANLETPSHAIWLTIDILICPAFLPNLTRKITAREPIAVDGVQIVFARATSEMKAELVRRIENRTEGLGEESDALDEAGVNEMRSYLDVVRAA